MNELSVKWVLAVVMLTGACGGQSVRTDEHDSPDGSSGLGGTQGGDSFGLGASGGSGPAGLGGGGTGSAGLAGKSGNAGVGGAGAGRAGSLPPPCSAGIRLDETAAEPLSRDWNGDGHLDLIYISTEQGRLRLLSGHGDGTFTPATALSGKTRQVLIEDFNGDARPDLAFIVGPSRVDEVTTLRLHLGNADGTFAPALDRPGPNQPAIAAGDIDGDGNLDLVLASNAVRLLLGNGDGTFVAGPEYPRDWTMRQAALRDFNGDGSLDILAGFECARGAPDLGSVLLGDGRGGFVPGDYQRFSPCELPEFGRVNRDSVLDMLTSDAHLIGRGDGTFEPPVQLPRSGIPGDFNGDGLLDLASIWYGWLDVLIGQGNGTFSGCVRTSERVVPPQP